MNETIKKELMSELGKLGVQAKKKKLGEEGFKKALLKANKARWANHKKLSTGKV